MLKKIIHDPTRMIAIAKLLARDFERCDLFRHASAMSYVTVFSIIPSLAAITAILSSFSPMLSDDLRVFNLFGSFFSDFTPTAIRDITVFIRDMLTTIDFKALGASGIIVLFFSLAFLLRQIEIAFNRIWLIRKNRSLIKRFLYFWTFTTLSLFGVSLGLALFANFKIDSILQNTAENLQNRFSFLSVIGNWFICFTVFTILYKVIPNCKVRFNDAFIGAAIATICLQVVTKVYAIFIGSIANYKTIYGTLAALPTFLLWLYLCWLIIMLGALFAWRWHQGFPVETAEEEVSRQDELISPEVFRQKNWATLSSLIIIHASFSSEEEHATILSIQKRTSLPVDIVTDQVDMLVKLGMVAIAAESQSAENGPIEHKLLPTQPSDKTSLHEVMQCLYGKPPHSESEGAAFDFMKIMYSKVSQKSLTDLKKTYLSDLF